MIKEIFRKDFPFNKEIIFSYKSTRYLDVITKSEENNFVFEFKIKEFPQPFIGKVVNNLFEDYKENCRFFVYLNQNKHETAVLSVGFQPLDICRIWDFYVEPSFRNLGIGHQLLEHAYTIAKEWSARVLVVQCQSSNYPAIKFFQKNGFLITGFDLIHNSRNDLRRHDFLLMMSKLMD